MSGGGGGKKRATRVEGWEKADGEFYQERYPTTEVDLEVLQRDATHIATLLPSKKSRAATNKRVRPTDTKTSTRRRTHTRRRESTVRRQSCANDVQVSMLPDLSQELSNEQDMWEEIMQIKAMPVSMAHKREMKAKLQSSTQLRLQGFEQFKWQRRKIWQHFRTRLKETYSKLELWRHSLKKIEGNFGTGVVAYFLFLKWLMFLNFVLFIFILCFIILPSIFLETTNSAEVVNNCTCFDGNCKNSSDVTDYILDIIQGTGDMQNTILFYGKYPNNLLLSGINDNIYYNLPLAYIFVTLSIYLFSLISIVKSAARGFKERLIEGEGQFYHYCNLVFGGWDYCIHNQKSAEMKHKALYNEIKACLEAKRLEDERKNRSRQEKLKLIILRTFINIFVIAMLIGSMASIIFVFDHCQTSLKSINPENDETNKYLILLLQFLPSLCITILNILVPMIFRTLITFERYSPSFVLRLTLLRTVVLKLLSLGVLVYSLYEIISNNDDKCWETYVGQQIYKLIITDFAIHVITTFFINFPRAIIAKKSDSKFAKFIGEQQYDLPKNVLDVVYSQTLCWLGVFFSPLLPAISSIAYFFMFYIKKFVCLVNSTPSSTVYRASRSNSMFMFVLLIAHCLAVIPVALSIAEINPSKCCGPFRDLSTSTVWQSVIKTFESSPDWLQEIIFKIGTAWFAVPVFIFLVLCIYYYSAVTDANRHMVDVLKNQLVLEGHDKQFLLNRLVEFSKQQQEYQKRIRNAEMLRERDRVSASQ